jgi:hypothetical protein
MARGDDDMDERLRRIDKQRKELLGQIEQARGDGALDRVSRGLQLAELHKDLYMLDYDDPRTPLGAAAAMSDTPTERLIDILFDLAVSRPPQDDERQRCADHLSKHTGSRKEAVHDIVWALCNSQEFVARIGK